MNRETFKANCDDLRERLNRRRLEPPPGTIAAPADPVGAQRLPYVRLWGALLSQQARAASRGDGDARDWLRAASVQPGGSRWVCEAVGVDYLLLMERVSRRR